VFSDPSVIDYVNNNYIACELDLTNNGWPDIPQLADVKYGFENTYHCRFGFSVNVIVGPGVDRHIGAAIGETERGLEYAIEYHPKKFVAFLEKCKKKYERKARKH